jgi:hypothetical protein
MRLYYIIHLNSAMNQNFSNILYLAFRLAPFSSYRFLASIDFKLGSEGWCIWWGRSPPFHGLLRKNKPFKQDMFVKHMENEIPTRQMQRYNAGERRLRSSDHSRQHNDVFVFAVLLLMFMINLARTSSSSSDSVSYKNISAKSSTG